MEVGVRELRNHLSRYLKYVQEGNDLVVTDRGHAVAKILPASGETTLDRLIREGKVLPPLRPKRRHIPPARVEPKLDKPLSQYVIEERQEGW
ncbi:MAG: type II toxin-antitoxin system prevent-host-death family antitoxin [Actinobacteria bacterium]|nr:type II toxin-antitoxin system prevent-host-death family antitoxin [Actinomycetota bacterium]